MKNYKTGVIHNLVAIICCLVVLISCSSANTEQDTSSDGSKGPTIYGTSESSGKPTVEPTKAITTDMSTPSKYGTSESSGKPTVEPTKAITTDISTPSNVGSNGIAEHEKDISKASITIEISPGSIARYRIEEQLARLTLPNDAVGETDTLDGHLLFNESGDLISGSKLSLDVASLTSDEPRRDRYVRRNTLKSDLFPTIDFEVRSVGNLEWPIPTEGLHEFQIVGDLTVMDVTKEISWEVSANVVQDSITGAASSVIDFETFGIDKPRLAFILSVDDDIRLELEFSAEIHR